MSVVGYSVVSIEANAYVVESLYRKGYNPAQYIESVTLFYSKIQMGILIFYCSIQKLAQ
jgi:hypothetical protein